MHCHRSEDVCKLTTQGHSCYPAGPLDNHRMSIPEPGSFLSNMLVVSSQILHLLQAVALLEDGLLRTRERLLGAPVCVRAVPSERPAVRAAALVGEAVQVAVPALVHRVAPRLRLSKGVSACKEAAHCAYALRQGSHKQQNPTHALLSCVSMLTISVCVLA